MMPPLHSAAHHGVSLLRWRNQDVFRLLATPPLTDNAEGWGAFLGNDSWSGQNVLLLFIIELVRMVNLMN